jgi:hypothetical protein
MGGVAVPGEVGRGRAVSVFGFFALIQEEAIPGC